MDKTTWKSDSNQKRVSSVLKGSAVLKFSAERVEHRFASEVA